MHYEEDFGMVCRIGRFHNIYGPCGTWKGGREKAPAAFCRKAITSTDSFEMWGNGARRPHAAQFSARNSPRAILRGAASSSRRRQADALLLLHRRRRGHPPPHGAPPPPPPPRNSGAQLSARNSRNTARNSPTRAFTTPRLSSPQVSDYKKPLNIGSDEMVSMNQMAEMIMEIGGKKLPIKHIPGPEGVRGRNSDNTLIKQVLGWAPQTTLKEGLGITYKWIDEQVAKYGADTKALTTSTVVGQTMTDSCDMGKAAGK